MRWLTSLSGLLALLLLSPAEGAAQDRQGYTAEQLIQMLKPATAGQVVPKTRGIRPATGTAAVGTADVPAVGVVPDLKIMFEFNSAELTPEARLRLDELGRALVSDELQRFRFRIAGYTDAVGGDSFNRSLSARRARSVVEYLTRSYGISTARLEALGLGESQLADPSNPESAVNRRVEIRTLN
jgi:OOP family OmpA-OmpF porin